MSSSFWLLRVDSSDFSQTEKERTACKTCFGPVRDYGQSVINFYILLIGNSLKCYTGELEVQEDTTEKEKKKEPKLADCRETDDVCVSQYIRTDAIFDSGETMLAGGWSKLCDKKSNTINYFSLTGEDLSDQCVEQKAYIKVRSVCIINA